MFLQHLFSWASNYEWSKSFICLIIELSLSFGSLSNKLISTWKLKMLLGNGKATLVTPKDEKYHFKMRAKESELQSFFGSDSSKIGWHIFFLSTPNKEFKKKKSSQRVEKKKIFFFVFFSYTWKGSKSRVITWNKLSKIEPNTYASLTYPLSPFIHTYSEIVRRRLPFSQGKKGANVLRSILWYV